LTLAASAFCELRRGVLQASSKGRANIRTLLISKLTS
jgi:hypothetical protein